MARKKKDNREDADKSPMNDQPLKQRRMSRRMNLDAYCYSLHEEYNRKPRGFGAPPATAGVGLGGNGSQTISEEMKQVMQVI